MEIDFSNLNIGDSFIYHQKMYRKTGQDTAERITGGKEVKFLLTTKVYKVK